MAKFKAGDVVRLTDTEHPQYERLTTPPADGTCTVQTAKVATDEVTEKKEQVYGCQSADGKCEFDAAENQLTATTPPAKAAPPAGPAKPKEKGKTPAASPATPKSSW